MPTVLDAPEVIDSEAQALNEEQPQTRPAHAGFWHTLLQYMQGQRGHRGQRTPSSSPRSVSKFELPVDAWARRYPALYIRAFAGE